MIVNSFFSLIWKKAQKGLSAVKSKEKDKHEGIQKKEMLLVRCQSCSDNDRQYNGEKTSQ